MLDGINVFDMQDQLPSCISQFALKSQTCTKANYEMEKFRHGAEACDLSPAVSLLEMNEEEREILKEVINKVEEESGVMRTINLEMQAFGSYGDRTKVDFRKPSQNLFLDYRRYRFQQVHYFDAIAFARYMGSSQFHSLIKSGNRRAESFPQQAQSLMWN